MKNKKLWISILAGIMAAIMILSLIVGILPHANAASSSEIKNQIGNLQNQQNDMQSQIDALKAQQKENLTEINDLVGQKKVIEQQVGLLHEQIDNMNEQIAAYALLIADKQEELEAAEQRLVELNKKNKERIRAMEEDGGLSYWSVLFKANSFSDFLDRLNMIEEIAAADRRRLKEMSEAAQQVEQAKAALIEEKIQLESSKDALAKKQEEQDAKAGELQQILNTLMAKGEEYEALLAKQEDELAKLEQEIANKEAEYDTIKYLEWLATSVPPTTKPSSGGSGGVGGSGSNISGTTWLVPCNYIRISSPFDYRWHPVHKDWRMHNGVDMAAGCPTPIYATRAGIVTISQWSDSAGWYVMIDHMDGFKSVYMHMCKRPNVKVGDIVAAGEVIGCVGTTGTSTGNHLHFGISKNGVYVNPMDYVG